MEKRKAKQPTMNRRKKSRLFQGNLDRISDLPDALLIQILCLLEMKDIVKTCVLSKRWYPLCTQVHTIILRFDFVPDILSFNQTQMKFERYASSINNIFKRGLSRIRYFSFSGFHSFGYLLECPKLRNWIECVLESNVEILKLDYRGFKNCTPPLSLFHCSSLSQLELSRSIILSVPVNLPLLKSLSLCSIRLTNMSLEDILVGCPVLETLDLVDVSTSINLIRIISPSLKKLKMISIKYVGPGRNVDLILVISASLLQELEISGCFMFRQCVTGDFSSLVKAKLMFTINGTTFVDDNGAVVRYITGMVTEFYNDWILMVEKLVTSICHVGELLIGSAVLQVLSVRASALLRNTLNFMCKHVTVVSPLWKYDLPGIVNLLEVAPHLETLVVGVVSWSAVTPPIDQVKEALHVVPLQFISNETGNLLHLKDVTIRYLRNSCSDYPLDHSSQTERKCQDFELVDYILRSCSSLEKLLLRSSRACTNGSCLNRCCAFQYVNGLSSKLLTHSLPQNEKAEWELKKKGFELEYTFSN